MKAKEPSKREKSMRHFTDTITQDLAEKLKQKGMSIDLIQHDVQGMIYADYAVTYAEAFDWFLESDIRIHLLYVPKSNLQDELWRGIVGLDIFEGTWHEAAEKVIEKALELI